MNNMMIPIHIPSKRTPERFNSINLNSVKIEINRSSHRRYSAKTGVLKKCYKFHRETPVLEFPFKKAAGLKACDFIKKRHRCFPVKFTKFLRTPILKNICGRLLLKQGHRNSAYEIFRYHFYFILTFQSSSQNQAITVFYHCFFYSSSILCCPIC